MRAVWLENYSDYQSTGKTRESLDKEQLKRQIILGGSSAFEAMINAFAKYSAYLELIHYLTDHTINSCTDISLGTTLCI